MRNVRLARGLAAFALFAGTSSLAVAQQLPPTQGLTEQEASGDPLAPLPTPAEQPSTKAVQTEVYDATGAAEARAEMTDRFGIDELAPGQFRWADDIPASGPTRIIVSLSDQLAFVYRGDQMIGVTTVSSGKTDHETPTGVFPILAKEKMHRSKTYENAPMPFMQRINEYGVALHGGNIPGFPASHGCVRLPMKFAERLFTLTTTGSEVVITA